MINRYKKSWGTALLYWYPISLLPEEWREKYREQITKTGTEVFSYLPFVRGAEHGIEIILPSATRGEVEAKREIISHVQLPNRERPPQPESVERVLLVRKYRHRLRKLRELAGGTDPKELSDEFWQMYNETVPGYSRAYPLPNGRLYLSLPEALEMEIIWEIGDEISKGSFYTYQLSGHDVYIRIFPAVGRVNQDRFFPTFDLGVEKTFPTSPECGERTLCRVYWLMARDQRVTGKAFPVL